MTHVPSIGTTYKLLDRETARLFSTKLMMHPGRADNTRYIAYHARNGQWLVRIERSTTRWQGYLGEEPKWVHIRSINARFCERELERLDARASEDQRTAQSIARLQALATGSKIP